jgi:chemotaxis protein CheZ
MPMRRKVFRVEEMRLAAPARNNPLADKLEPGGAPHSVRAADDVGNGIEGLRQLKDETDSIFHAINRTKQQIAALHVSGLSGPENGRVRRQLDAVVDGAEQAIQQILAAAEDIDEAANTLSAVLKQEQNQALAQDIRDQVLRIFEACNFHDLAGQRIGKVLTTLKFVEDRVARMMEIWGGIDAFNDYAARAPAESAAAPPPLLNGPKLDGEAGHASQSDIDALFRLA